MAQKTKSDQDLFIEELQKEAMALHLQRDILALTLEIKALSKELDYGNLHPEETESRDTV